MQLWSAQDVRAAAPMGKAIEAMRQAFVALAQGRVQLPVRTVLPTEHGHTLVMPATLAGSSALTVKIVSVLPDNPLRGLPRIVGTVLLIDAATGVPRALLEGASITALRTAAAAGLATEVLARADSHVLALLGAGALARDLVDAIAIVRPLTEVRVFAPSRAHAAAVVADLPVSLRARAVDTAADAVRGADVVVCATNSRLPVFDDADLAPGTHVCAMGAWQPDVREIPGTTMARARVIVDDAHAAWSESGDLLLARAEGLLDEARAQTTLGEVLLGQKAGRQSADEVTLFESVGLAIQDLALAQLVCSP